MSEQAEGPDSQRETGKSSHEWGSESSVTSVKTKERPRRNSKSWFKLLPGSVRLEGGSNVTVGDLTKTAYTYPIGTRQVGLAGWGAEGTTSQSG